MREFSVQEIETYATRAQASAALSAALNALNGLVGLDIFSSEEKDALQAAYNEVMEVATANDARIRVTEEALSRFQAVKPSQKALVNLISMLEDLKAEVKEDAGPAVSIKEGEPAREPDVYGGPTHYTMDGEHPACGAKVRDSNFRAIVVHDWKQVTCGVCMNLNQL